MTFYKLAADMIYIYCVTILFKQVVLLFKTLTYI